MKAMSLVSVVACSGALLVAGIGSASAVTLTCGATIAANSGVVVADNDLSCTETVTLIVQGPGTTLDLNNHTINCDGGQTGIQIIDKATVKNGYVRNCASAGVELQGSNSKVQKIVASGGFMGFYISGGSANVVDSCIATGNNGRGFYDAAAATAIRSSVARQNGLGFLIDPSAAGGGKLTQNTATKNASAGFSLQAPGTKAIKNLAVSNETGIEVIASGVVLKQNTASANGIGLSVDADSASVLQNYLEANDAGLEISGNGNRVVKNRLRANGSDGMRVVGGTNQSFKQNTAFGNGDLDISDATACAGGVWSGNNFGTASDDCIH